MPAGLRSVILFVAAIGLFLSAPAPLHAQEKKVEGAIQDVKAAVEDGVKRIMPNLGGGTPIDQGQPAWAYVGGVVGFIVVFWIAWFFVRLLAFLVIAICFLGGIAVVCISIHEKSVTTWEQLAVIVVSLAATAGVTSVVANVFLISGGIEGKDKE